MKCNVPLQDRSHSLGNELANEHEQPWNNMKANKLSSRRDNFLISAQIQKHPVDKSWRGKYCGHSCLMRWGNRTTMLMDFDQACNKKIIE